MKLPNDQPFIYAWRYTNDTICKLGVSTTRTFHTHIKAATLAPGRAVELLGIALYDTPEAAKAAYRQRLKQFEQVKGRRAWVHISDAVTSWLADECLSDPPSLDAFKAVYLNDAARREKARGYQRKHAVKRKASRRQSEERPKKRTEQQKAYNREQARKRRQDPAHRKKQNAYHKQWREKNPDYYKARYANDPEYREKRKTAQRERYAKNAELRERRKEYLKQWRQQNPDYNERRREYMRKWREKNPDYYKKWYREKVKGEDK